MNSIKVKPDELADRARSFMARGDGSGDWQHANLTFTMSASLSPT
jgi:hypothetical protein